MDFHGKINELTDIFSSCFLVCIFELAIIVFFFNLVSKFHLLTKSQFSISLLRSKNVNQHIMSFAELYIIFHFCFLIFCYQKRLLPAKPHGFAMRIMAYIRISRSHRKAQKTLTSSTIFFFYTHWRIFFLFSKIKIIQLNFHQITNIYKLGGEGPEPSMDNRYSNNFRHLITNAKQ